MQILNVEMELKSSFSPIPTPNQGCLNFPLGFYSIPKNFKGLITQPLTTPGLFYGYRFLPSIGALVTLLPLRDRP